MAGASLVGEEWSRALFEQLGKRAAKLKKAERSRALACLAGDQAKVGDLAAAHATAAKISDAFDACNAVDRIAAAQAQSGDVAGAKATLARISAAWQKTSGSAALVRALLRVGNLAGAEAATADVASAEGQARLRREIAAAQAWAEGPAAAAEWAESLDERWLSHSYAALGAAEAAVAMSQGLAQSLAE